MSERGAAAEALRSRAFRSDQIAWVVVAGLLAAAAYGGNAWLHRRVRADGPFSAAPRLERRLQVLAYDRIADGVPGALEARRFADHLEALRAAGFHAVSLAQVRAAYREGAGLPDRAVLLTFDGGHRSTFDAVDSLLRRAGWPAVMFLDPRVEEGRNSTYVYWDALRRMVDSGIWALGTLGSWPAAARILEARLPAAPALARVRSGQEAPRGPEPPLVFESSLFGVSDAFTDPAHLLRLRVSPAWTGRELVERLLLARAAPRAGPGGPPPVSPDRWTSTIGQARAVGDGLELAGAPRADAWLAGSEWAQDFALEAEVRVERGPFWIVHQRAGAGEQWRWGGTQGVLYLERVHAGGPIEVVSQLAIPVRPGVWHRVRVVKRGGGVWVEWDGAPLTDTPRALAARWRGPVGVSAGSPRQPGRVELRRVRFGAIPYAARAVSASPAEDEVRALVADAATVAAVSPPLLVQQGARVERRPFDHRMLDLLAARGAWDVLPSLQLADDQLARRPGAARELTEIAAREGWAGLRLDSGRLSPAAREAWGAAVPAWREAFAARGLRLVLDPEVPSSATGASSP